MLIKGATVYLSVSSNPQRATKYDLVAVEKKKENNEIIMVNMDSQIPNDVVAEWLPQSGLFSKEAVIRREVGYNKSRFDFCITDGKKVSFIEVKGVTLESDGHALFPDAPTLRGVKHITELMNCVKEDFGAYIIFVIQMKGIKLFSPNDSMHGDFGTALRQAEKAGVKILAMDCLVTFDTIKIDQPVKIQL